VPHTLNAFAAICTQSYTVCHLNRFSSATHRLELLGQVPPDIAFITASYNTLHWTKQIADFFATLDVPFTFSLTVVDNSSFDGSQDFLQSQSRVHYIQTGQNLGYGRAINRGVAATASRYVCVTNTDVILNRDALLKLWRFMEEYPEAGVCAPRITYADGRNQGMIFKPFLISHYAEWLGKLAGWSSKSKLAHAAGPFRVDGVMGAFFLIRRSTIPQPTLFDEEFFFFYEDSALAHTLKNRGVPCYVVPNASIIHVGGQSRSAAAVSFFYQGKYLYLSKFYGSVHAKGVFFVDRFRVLRKYAFYSLLALLTSSKRIKSKQRHYQIAWYAPRPKA
jgi:N-acetylglucosaminyl-diphospho-decaprenol L-rhamnosyltransferase